jgi:LmbE family N-acetylglucosaminyl deacetylase
MNKILIIAAHPDDETLGVGGAILKHVEANDHVTVFIAADGVTARHDQIEQQQEAALRACRKLGVVDVRFGGLPDQRLDEFPLLELIAPLSQLIKDLRPKVVYTHHGGDVNQDHRAIFEATLIAARPVGDYPVKELYCYEVPSSTEWAPPLNHWVFQPNVYVDIEPFLDKKIEAALEYTRTYQSEIPPYPHPRSPQAIEIYAKRRGIEVGLRAAEAFMLIRKLG